MVLNVDDERLRGTGRRAWPRRPARVRVLGVRSNADVAVVARTEAGAVWIRGDDMGEVGHASTTVAGNAACALAAASSSACPSRRSPAARRRCPSRPTGSTVATSDAGVAILDDTFNSNPAGAAGRSTALRAADRPRADVRVVVTPGMIELGPRQHEENAALRSRTRPPSPAPLVIVGRTNRRALVRGARGGAMPRWCVVDAERRRWRGCSEHLGRGDAVLYENDLPDHYP